MFALQAISEICISHNRIFRTCCFQNIIQSYAVVAVVLAAVFFFPVVLVTGVVAVTVGAVADSPEDSSLVQTGRQL